jgi:hypothetical protein
MEAFEAWEYFNDHKGSSKFQENTSTLFIPYHLAQYNTKYIISDFVQIFEIWYIIRSKVLETLAAICQTLYITIHTKYFIFGDVH